MENQTELKPLAISVRQFREALSIGNTLAFQLIREGRVEKIKAGRRTLVTMSSVEAFLASGSAEGAAND